MERDLFFYRANFTSEINRLLDAFENGDDKYVDNFKIKVLELVDKILEFKMTYKIKKMWLNIKKMINDISSLKSSEKEFLRSVTFFDSVKFMTNLNITKI